MTYTREDLTTMQGWSLQRKIQVSQTRIYEWYLRNNGNVYVSFSGGKDSTVLLDLVRRVAPDVPAVFIDTGLEFPELRNFVSGFNKVDWVKPKMPFNQVIKQFGFPVISKEVAERVYYARRGSQWALNAFNGLNTDGSPSDYKAARFTKYQYLLDAPFPISAYCCKVLKKAPAHQYEKQSGRYPIVGSMAAESELRKHSYLKSGCNAFDAKRPISNPMGFWTEQDVLAYLNITKIPYASVYGDIIDTGKKLFTSGVDRTGCMFCMFSLQHEKQPNRFQRMAETHPKLHDYCINKLGCGKVLDWLKIPYQPEPSLWIQEQLKKAESQIMLAESAISPNHRGVVR